MTRHDAPRQSFVKVRRFPTARADTSAKIASSSGPASLQAHGGLTRTFEISADSARTRSGRQNGAKNGKRKEKANAIPRVSLFIESLSRLVKMRCGAFFSPTSTHRISRDPQMQIPDRAYSGLTRRLNENGRKTTVFFFLRDSRLCENSWNFR